MPDFDCAALLDAILTRAAEQLGDLTPLVYARYFARFPEAPAIFEELHPGSSKTLQGDMVEQVLYCLMQWLETPGEIEIILLGTVPHHADTLKVSPALFLGLLEEVVIVVAETIPEHAAAEQALWRGIHDEIAGVVTEAARWAWSVGQQQA